MILRRVDGDDFGSIYGLVRLLGDSGPFAELKYLLEGLLEDPQRELVLVADDEDRAVGLMCLHQGPGKGGRGFQVTIQELMTRPGVHGQEIEQRLIRFAEQYSRSTEAFLLPGEEKPRAKGIIRKHFEQKTRKRRKAAVLEL